MFRIEIGLTADLREYLWKRKRLAGESISSVVRRAVEGLQRREPIAKPSGMVQEAGRDVVHQRKDAAKIKEADERVCPDQDQISKQDLDVS